jgi:acetyl esterase/lipase
VRLVKRIAIFAGALLVGVLVGGASRAGVGGEGLDFAAMYEDRYPPTTQETFLTFGERKLDTLVYRPVNWHAGSSAPAMVLFFGGGWRKGSPWSFAPFAAHFRDEGFVVFLPDYRVRGRDGTTIPDAVRDARSFMRWLKLHAAQEGIDPKRIVAGGGSAGGHLAAALAVVPLDNAGDDLSIDPKPAALLLYNPAANLDSGNEVTEPKPTRFGATKEEFREADPTSRIGPGYPPCIVFHGTADHTVPFESVVRFVDAVKAKGGSCELVPYEGRDHGFFNPAISKPEDTADVLKRSDAFLKRLGYP